MIQFDEHISRMGWNHQLDNKRDAHFSGLLCFHNWNSDFTHAGMINGEEMKFFFLVDALGVQKIETTHSWITAKYRFGLSFWVISYNTGWIFHVFEGQQLSTAFCRPITEPMGVHMLM